MQDAMKQVSADMVITPQMNMTGAFAGNGVMAENLSNNTSILNPIVDAISQLKGNEGGDTIIPVYIGQDRIDEIVVTAHNVQITEVEADDVQRIKNKWHVSASP